MDATEAARASIMVVVKAVGAPLINQYCHLYASLHSAFAGV